MLDGFAEVASDVRHSREKQISKAMPFQAFTRLEAVLKQARKQCLLFRKRNNAVANVAGWGNVQVLAKTSA